MQVAVLRGPRSHARRGGTARKFVTESLLDRICCQLGIHPSEIYGTDYEVAS